MPSIPRTCAQCATNYSKPERFFRVQGRGYLKICLRCERGGKPGDGYLQFLLTDITNLLRSPMCGRCGARGAERETSQAGVVSFICGGCK